MFNSFSLPVYHYANAVFMFRGALSAVRVTKLMEPPHHYVNETPPRPPVHYAVIMLMAPRVYRILRPTVTATWTIIIDGRRF